MTPLLKLSSLSMQVKNKHLLHQIDLEINENEIVGLLGHNGAGKSTLFSLIMGLYQLTEGSIAFNNTSLINVPIPKRASMGIGYLAQESTLFHDLTVIQNLLIILETLPLTKKQREKKAKGLLELMGIIKLANRKAGLLSGGEKRRAEIARLLIHSPSLLLLDEPFANIDPITIKELKHIIRSLKQRGVSILICDHNAHETLTLVDRCYVLHQGKILASGSSMEIQKNRQVCQNYLAPLP